MKYNLTIKYEALTPRAEKILTRNITSLQKKLANFADDIPELSFFLKKHEKNHFVSGLLTLTLPRKKLIAKIAGNELNDVIHQAFEKLNKEFETYKGKHFKGSSKYPHHKSLKTKNIL